MEYLEIENFLTITKAKLEVKRINIIIGEQATGKSIVAKLLYFFQDFLSSTFIDSIISNKNQRELKKETLSNFEKWFPKYAWREQEFKVSYKFGRVQLVIERLKNQQGSFRLNFSYSDYCQKLYIKLKNKVLKAQQEIKKSQDSFQLKKYFKVRRYLSVLLKETAKIYLNLFLRKTLFVPASRSFFSMLETNIFSFLANNINIDPSISKFGSAYENVKSIYNVIDKPENSIIEYDEDKSLYKKLKKLVVKIIAGDYLYEEKQDWIISSNNKKINLINASSGQQEALPILLILSVFPFMENFIEEINIFIEEPEAHLFPFAQKDMINLFALLYKYKSCNFFITTHSPYILTAFNNLIMASNIEEETKQKVSFIENKVNYEDVAAYTIKDGILKSILDSEVKLIGTNIIDSVSDQFEKEFDELIKIQINS